MYKVSWVLWPVGALVAPVSSSAMHSGSLSVTMTTRKLSPGAALAFLRGVQDMVQRFLAGRDLGLRCFKNRNREEMTRLLRVDTRESECLGLLQPRCPRSAVALHSFGHHPVAADASRRSCRTALKVVAPVGATTTVLIGQVPPHDVGKGPPLIDSCLKCVVTVTGCVFWRRVASSRWSRFLGGWELCEPRAERSKGHTVEAPMRGWCVGDGQR